MSLANNASPLPGQYRYDHAEPDTSGEERDEAIGELAAEYETDAEAIFDALESLAETNQDEAVMTLAEHIAAYMREPTASAGWQVVGALRTCLEAKLQRMAEAEVDRQHACRGEP